MSAVSLQSTASSGPRGPRPWLRRPDSFALAAGVPVAVISLVILGLLGTVVVLSLTPIPASGLSGPTFANYVGVFSDPHTLQILLNSLLFALISLVVAFAVGVPVAWLVECTDIGGKGVIIALMLVALLIPGFASAAGWLFLLHPRIGLLNVAAMQVFGLDEAPFNVLSIAGMGWVEGLSRVPIAFLMASTAFRSLDRSLEEAALTAGASGRTVLTRIMLPLVRPALLSAGIYIFMIGFGSFDVPAIIGWGNRIFVFSTYIYLLTNPQDVFPGYGPPAALSTVVLGFALVLIWWARRIMQQSHRYAVISGKAYRPRLARLGRARYAAWIFFGAFITVALVLPLLVLGWASLLPFLQLPSRQALSLVSLQNYRTMPWDLLLAGLRHTAILAIAAPPLVLLFSFLFSWIGFRTRLPGRTVLDQIAFTPHAVPHIVIAMGFLLMALYVIQPVLPIYGTVWVLLFAFVIAWLSYGTRITNSGLIQIHRELEESARISGASTWSVVRRVVVPLLSHGFFLAGLYIALLTARELTLSVLLSTPANMTLPVAIWSVWINGGLGKASAALVCFILCVLPFILFYIMAMQKPRSRGAAAAADTSRLAIGNAT
jgi:iron(III) transport system permease protein